MLQVTETQKEQQKQQRLANLSAQWFEMEMNRVAYEANGKDQQVAEVVKLQKELEVSYEAIQKM